MKAELFSTDFLISIILFLSILVILGLYYENLQTDIYEQYVRNDMQRKAINVADLLATSSGSPQFWDSSNVKVIGLYDSGKFNLTKLEELKKIDYTTIKKMLGVNYELYVEIKNETGNVFQKKPFAEPIAYFSKHDVELQMSILGNSSAVWDFYWGETTDIPNSSGARYFYYGDTGDVISWLISNISEYNTIFFEDPHSSPSPGEQQTLKDFVSNGGTFFQSEHGDLIGIFNISYSGNGERNGIIKALNSILKGVSVGDSVYFNESAQKVWNQSTDSPLDILVYPQGEPDKALLGHWKYGNGDVFYISDFVGDISGNPLMNSMEVLPFEYSFGIPIANDAEQVVSIKRLGLVKFEGNVTKVIMEVILWV